MSSISSDVLLISPDPRQLGGKPGVLTVTSVLTGDIQTDKITPYLTTEVDSRNIDLNVEVGGDQLGASDGIATLDTNGWVPLAQIPPSVQAGLDAHGSCRLKTASALPSYNATGAEVTKKLTGAVNGALPLIDGVAPALTDRILLDQFGSASNIDNGIYTVTNLGSSITKWEFTRSTDSNTNGSITSGSFTFVTEGSTASSKGFIVNTADPIVLDVTPFTWTTFSSSLTGITSTISTALGLNCLTSVTTGLSNTASGYHAGAAITSGDSNSFFGENAGKLITTGGQNVAMGADALGATAIAVTGMVALGFETLKVLTTAINCTAVGWRALTSNTSGSNCVAVGTQALGTNSTGTNCTAVGSLALANSDAADNTAVGKSALNANTGGSQNTAVGKDSSLLISSGIKNTSFGWQALKSVTTSNYGTAIGAFALPNTTGAGNIGVGYNTGSTLTSGTNNTIIGTSANVTSSSAVRRIAIGANASCSADYGAQIGQATVSPGSTAVMKFRTQTVGNEAWVDGLTGIAGIDATGNIYKTSSSSFGVNTEYNTGFGLHNFTVLTTGFSNVGFGVGTFNSLTNGDENTAIGYFAQQATSTGNRNTAMGNLALSSVSTASNNTAIGNLALRFATGARNTAIGSYALRNITTGNNNSAIGYRSGFYLTVGSRNILIGDYSDAVSINNNSAISIGCYARATTSAISIGSSLPTTTNGPASNSAGAIVIGSSGTSSYAYIGTGSTGSIAIGSGSGTQSGARIADTSVGCIAIGGSDGIIDGASSNGGANSISIGTYAYTNSDRCTSIGYRSYANSGDSISIGSHSTADATFAIAIGSGTTINSGAQAHGSRSIAIGNGSDAAFTSASVIAIGTAGASSAGAVISGTSTNSIAIGCGGSSTGAGARITNVVGAIAIGGGGSSGAGAACSGANSIAIGSANSTLAGASATTANSIAIGGASGSFAGAIANQTESISIGMGATPNATASSIQLGRATNTSTGVFRYRNQIVSQESWADSLTSPASIDGSGNIVKTSSTPGVASDTIALTNENVQVATTTVASSFVTTTVTNPLTSSAIATGIAGSFLGQSVTIADDPLHTSVYGSPGGDANTFPLVAGTAAGTISFRLGPGTTATNTITLPTIATADLFGFSVALSANGLSLAVGAPGRTNTGALAGVVYLWERSNAQTASWGSSVRTLIDDVTASDNFGYAIAFSADGSTLIVGAPGNTNGNVYIYARNTDGLWASAPTLQVTASRLGTTTANFGASVAIDGSGNTVVIGSRATPGTVWYSTRISSTWTSATQLVTTASVAGDGYGRAVAISQDSNTIVAGASTKTTNTGEVTVWQRSGSTYPTVAQTIVGPAINSLFGQSLSVSLDGMRLIIGVPTTASAGAVHDYYRVSFGTTYLLNRAAFITGDGTNGKFGWTIAMSPDASNITIGTNNNSTLTKFYYQSFNASGKLLAGSVLGQTKKVSISTFTSLSAGSPVAKYDLYTVTPADVTTIARDAANRDISVVRFENRGAYANLLYDTNSSKWLIQESSGVTLY